MDPLKQKYDLYERLAQLSPEKRALVAPLLKQHDIDITHLGILPQQRETGEYPLSFAQERLWFLSQLEPDSPFYNEHLTIQLTGPLDLAALEDSLNSVVQRHEVLRTIFTQGSAGQPVQVILPSLNIPILLTDLMVLPAPKRMDKALQDAVAIARQPFDLAKGPLVRAAVFRLYDEDHLLIIVLHHIVADGWSRMIMMREVTQLYTAYSTAAKQGQSPDAAEILPPLFIQYADYAQWQRQVLQPDVIDKQCSYWKQQLAHSPIVLELPIALPRPMFQTFQGATQMFRLSKSLTEAFQHLSQQEGATLFMTLLAAFKVLLYRYTGQYDLVVGTRVAGRSHTETEGLIGFFVNVLVLRTTMRGDLSFRSLLSSMRETTLTAYAHQDVPFEKLVEVLRPQRSLSHQPLFQVMFVLQNTPMSSLHLPGLELHPMPLDISAAKYDLDLAMEVDVYGQLMGALTYNTALFESASIQRLIEQFQILLAGIVEDPDRPVDTLPLLTSVQRDQTLVAWNDTNADYPSNSLLHTLFEAQVERSPEAAAMIYAGEMLTYQELNWRANQLAHYLQTLGVGPEVSVGVCIERSLQTIIALMAIIKAGGVYVPLDPAYPPEILSFILANTQMPILLTEQRLLPELPDQSHQIILLDTQWAVIAQQPSHNPPCSATPDNLAYVMYTSGSTGQPKGVAVPQRQLLNRFAWMWNAYPFAAGEITCQRTTVSFSVSMWELLGPLLQGVPTVILPDIVVKDPQRFVQALADYQITRIVVVPSLLQMILEIDLDLEALLPALKLCSSCGEPLSPVLARRVHERLPHVTLVNQYGASEMNDVATYNLQQYGYPELRIPIGQPIANTQIYILDRFLQPVPIGVPGELYVGSIGLARGYLNHPAMTAEKFIPNPFGNQPGARLYKTGDLAYRRADGMIEGLGRRDHQVKIRGVRIELDGIEALLDRHPCVHRALVTTYEYAHDDKRLIAYIVPKTIQERPTWDHGDISSELRTFLHQQLPPYMVPSEFIVLDALPLTPNGKINRSMLPQPKSRQTINATFNEPNTIFERKIAAIWQSTLHIERVGLDDNFFDLGGHSLLIIRVKSELEEKLGRAIHLVELFEHPTVRALAKHLSHTQSESASFQHLHDQVEVQRASRRRRKQYRQELSAIAAGSGVEDVEL
jgi:amino acid adenylation domain-containing protein